MYVKLRSADLVALCRSIHFIIKTHDSVHTYWCLLTMSSSDQQMPDGVPISISDVSDNFHINLHILFVKNSCRIHFVRSMQYLSAPLYFPITIRYCILGNGQLF